MFGPNECGQKLHGSSKAPQTVHDRPPHLEASQRTRTVQPGRPNIAAAPDWLKVGADLPPPAICCLPHRCSATHFAKWTTENISTAFSGWSQTSVGGYQWLPTVTEASHHTDQFHHFGLGSKATDPVFLPVGGEEPASSRLHLEGKNEPSRAANDGGENRRTGAHSNLGTTETLFHRTCWWVLNHLRPQKKRENAEHS